MKTFDFQVTSMIKKKKKKRECYIETITMEKKKLQQFQNKIFRKIQLFPKTFKPVLKRIHIIADNL